MSLRGRVRRLMAKFDRRQVLVEDSVDRIEGAVENLLEMASEERARNATFRADIERAVAELGRTIRDDILRAMADERERRVGLGREVMRQSSTLDEHERRIALLEPGRGANGAAE